MLCITVDGCNQMGAGVEKLVYVSKCSHYLKFMGKNVILHKTSTIAFSELETAKNKFSGQRRRKMRGYMP